MAIDYDKLPPVGIAQVALLLTVPFSVPAVANAEKRFFVSCVPQLGHFAGLSVLCERSSTSNSVPQSLQ